MNAAMKIVEPEAFRCAEEKCNQSKGENRHESFWAFIYKICTGAPRSRREDVADYDLGHLRAVRRPTGRRVDHLGRLAEILRAYSGWSDDAQRLGVLTAVVVEPVNGTRTSGALIRPLDIAALAIAADPAGKRMPLFRSGLRQS